MLKALLFIGGGGGGGFFALDGGGGGGCFLLLGNIAFGVIALKVVELPVLDGTLPYDVAGDADLSPKYLSGLPF